MKKIISIPHPTLRMTAKPVEVVDKKLKKFVSELEETISKKKNPQGVGLASNQVDKLLRIFCINLKGLETYINPKITKRSPEITLGEDEDDPIMEGCLSMPELYGAVPRFAWVEVAFEVIEGHQLIKKESRLEDFHARVFQHELDHLNGILFTDHSLKYNLPVYKEFKRGKYEEVEPSILEMF